MLKLAQDGSRWLARIFLLPFTWYSLGSGPGPGLGRARLNAEATPPSCRHRGGAQHQMGVTATQQGYGAAGVLSTQ